MAMPVKHELAPEELFCLEGCRSYAQYHHMRRHFEHGHCVFCDLDLELNKILWEDESVYAFCPPPEFIRTPLALHLIIIPKRHVRFEVDLTEPEYLSVRRAKQFIYGRFEYKGGLTHVREGDMRYNSGSVPHLHYNIMVPNGTGEVRIPIFKNPADRLSDKIRAEEFEKRYKIGELPD